MKLPITVLLSLFISFNANALNMELYVYGGFTTTVNAFERLALMFALDWGGLIISLFAGGLMAAALQGGIKGLADKVQNGGGESSILGSMMFCIFGMMLFQGLVHSKGTIHIYDEERNQYQAVGQVPDIILLVAGGTNRIVHLFKDTEDTSDPYPYGKMADGSLLTMLQRATSEPSKFYDGNLVANIGAFYQDCSMAAVRHGFNVETLRSKNDDIWGTLDKLKNQMIPTSYRNGGSTTTETCTSAYTKLTTQLVSNASTYEGHLKAVCNVASLHTNKANELNACKDFLAEMVVLTYDVNIGWEQAMRNIIVAESIKQNLIMGLGSDAVELQLERYTSAQSQGIFVASGVYVPIIKSMLYSIILGLTPIILMLLVTPLMGNSLKAFFTLFAFYTLWELCDMVAVRAISDSMYAAMDELKWNAMGLKGIWDSPNASQKAMNIFQESRSMALMVTVLLTSILFKVSAHPLSSIASQAEGNVEEQGRQIGEKFGMEEHAGDAYKHIADGSGNYRALQDAGMNTARDSAQVNASAGFQRSSNIVDDSGGSVSEAGRKLGDSQSVSDIAQSRSVDSASLPTAIDSAQAHNDQSIGDGLGIAEAAGEKGVLTQAKDNSTLDNTTKNAQTNTLNETLGRSGAIESAGNAGALNAANIQGKSEHYDNNTHDDIAAATTAGMDKNVSSLNTESRTAQDNGSSITEMAKDTARGDTLQQLGENKARSLASDESLIRSSEIDTGKHIARNESEDKTASILNTTPEAIAAESAKQQTIDDVTEHNAMNSVYGSDTQTRAEHFNDKKENELSNSKAKTESQELLEDKLDMSSEDFANATLPSTELILDGEHKQNAIEQNLINDNVGDGPIKATLNTGLRDETQQESQDRQTRENLDQLGYEQPEVQDLMMAENQPVPLTQAEKDNIFQPEKTSTDGLSEEEINTQNQIQESIREQFESDNGFITDTESLNYGAETERELNIAGSSVSSGHSVTQDDSVEIKDGAINGGMPAATATVTNPETYERAIKAEENATNLPQGVIAGQLFSAALEPYTSERMTEESSNSEAVSVGVNAATPFADTGIGAGAGYNNITEDRDSERSEVDRIQQQGTELWDGRVHEQAIENLTDNNELITEDSLLEEKAEIMSDIATQAIEAAATGEGNFNLDDFLDDNDELARQPITTNPEHQYWASPDNVNVQENIQVNDEQATDSLNQTALNNESTPQVNDEQTPDSLNPTALNNESITQVNDEQTPDSLNQAVLNNESTPQVNDEQTPDSLNQAVLNNESTPQVNDEQTPDSLNPTALNNESIPQVNDEQTPDSLNQAVLNNESTPQVNDEQTPDLFSEMEQTVNAVRRGEVGEQFNPNSDGELPEQSQITRDINLMKRDSGEERYSLVNDDGYEVGYGNNHPADHSEVNKESINNEAGNVSEKPAVQTLSEQAPDSLLPQNQLSNDLSASNEQYSESSYAVSSYAEPQKASSNLLLDEAPKDRIDSEVLAENKPNTSGDMPDIGPKSQGVSGVKSSIV